MIERVRGLWISRVSGTALVPLENEQGKGSIEGQITLQVQ
jgi:hypothetical protein